MRRLSFDDQEEFCYSLSASEDPRLSIDPGEQLTVETEDGFLGQISEPGDRRDRSEQPRSNPLSGPIYVDGAESGDALVIHVENIRPKRGQAATYVPSWWSYLGSLSARQTMEDFLEVDMPNPSTILPIEDGVVKFSDTLDLPYEPMIGTIATAPESGSLPHGTAWPSGGNMDLPCIQPGSTVILPVNTDGALLYIGDAHAIQGDGEITFVGAEMAAEITVEIEVEKDAAPNWPKVETDEYLYTVGVQNAYNELRDALRLAYVNLVNWLADYGIEKWDAWQLCALNGKVRLGNLHCVAAGYPKADL